MMTMSRQRNKNKLPNTKDQRKRNKVVTQLPLHQQLPMSREGKRAFWRFPVHARREK